MSEGITVATIRGQRLVPLARTSSCGIFLYDQGRRALAAGRAFEAAGWFSLCCEMLPVEHMHQPESFTSAWSRAREAFANGSKLQAAALIGLKECDAWETLHPGEFA